VTKAEFLHTKALEIKRQRTELGLTRADVAAGIGVAVNSVRHWEDETAVMGVWAQYKLKNFFKSKWLERGHAVKAEQDRAALEESDQ
jgi:DNA-binding XRE family transcriptional regulator